MPWAKSSVALLRACHPGPAAAVTVLAVVFAAGSGLDAAGLALLFVAVGSGQLVIGWTNDLVDADRDRHVGRTDKPLVSGEIAPGALRRSLALAGALTVVASLACGWLAGTVHLALVVGGGLAYDLGLKRTVWSFVPYLVAFGSLPAVATLSLPAREWPTWWVMAASGLLGVGAHLVNVLPDLADDRATGVAGLPQRLGAGRVRVLAPVVLGVATALLLWGPAGDPGPIRWGLATLVVVIVLATVWRKGKAPFHGALAVAAVDVVLLLTR